MSDRAISQAKSFWHRMYRGCCSVLKILVDAIVAFVLSFGIIYTAVYVTDTIFFEKKDKMFSFDSFIKKIREKL